MNAAFFINSFNAILDSWIADINQYSYAQLCAKPSFNSWSMGQLCKHIIEETGYYIEQIKNCLSTEGNKKEEMSYSAKKMFLNNAFSDAKIEGDLSHQSLPQPDSKEQVLVALKELKQNMNEAYEQLRTTTRYGKTKHSGLGYFSADEWLQFADMHFRHHIGQKNRIDAYLKQQSIYDL